MNFKKISVKTEERVIKQTTKTVEIDFDFTQIYDCMYSLSFNIKSPISFQILFYLLKTMTSDNMINVSNDLYNRFIEEKLKHNSPEISRQSFYKCIKELKEAKIISQINRGQYFVNPYILWKDDKDKRVEYIKADRLGQPLAYNPKENLNYLQESETIYNNVPKEYLPIQEKEE